MSHIEILRRQIETLLSTGLSLTEIATRAEMSVGGLHDIKSGRAKSVTTEIYARVMAVIPGPRKASA
jgi:DNA-binding Xre family transcriptional regulator